jgi:hypothetical protein
MSVDSIFYDIEIAKNRCIVGFLDGEEFHTLDLRDRAMTAGEKDALLELCEGRTLVGYNNSGFDTYLLYYLLERKADPADVHELAQAIISSGKGWEVAKQMNARRSGLNEIDLLHFCKRAKLKVYEARLGMDRVETLPFDPNASIEDDMMPSLMAYLRHDLEATKRLYLSVKDEIDIRRELCDIFNLPNLMTRGPASAAEAVLLSEYVKADGEVQIDDIRSASRRHHNVDISFHLEDWVHRTCKGTVAEDILKKIEGTTFRYRGGKREEPDRQWPSLIDLDGAEATFGVGGLHSTDSAGVNVRPCVDADVASYYPRLLLAPGGAPDHLDQELFRNIYRGLLERRLEAKHAGRKREANALKLVLNSSFGKLGDFYSPLFSPASFLHITVGGQLSLIALAERINSKKGAILK